jgi:small-conductance mechanosensitive channel
MVWTDEANQLANLNSELRYQMWDVLAAHSIEIPLPLRDIHIRSGFSQ